jgi:toxin ParE1/3/4
MSGFRLLPPVESDLDDIWLYIARESGNIETATRLVESLVDRFALIALHRQIGRGRDHDLAAGLRSFPVGEYLIIYRVEEEGVVIIHVVQGSRDLEAIMRE